MSETKLLHRILIEGTSADCRLFRNNCGMATYKSKSGETQKVRYGLANPGGSDIIGIRRRVITEADVGKEIGQFLAIEVKYGNRQLTDKQRGFLQMVEGLGGAAVVIRDLEKLKEFLS